MELDNPDHVYTVSSGLICLGIAVVFGAIFARTLLVKFPDLFETDSLESAWKVLDIAPIVTTASVVWMNPVSAENVMTGRLRMICLVVLPSIPAVAWFLYHIFWWLAKKMTETTKLQHGYDLLQMEEKQYRRTRRYLQETSEIRHDFRQHIVYISELLEQGQIEKAKKYLSPIMETVNRTHRIICTNQAIDAIANHYDDIARSRNVVVSWSFDLTDKLPIDEADMCAVMGNLVENAIQAAEQLEGDNRLVNVRIGLLPPKTLVISIYNAYKGRLILDKNGLPVTEKKNHGIGLRSVRNIVERYGGTMEIETHNGIFNVSILMYAPD
jgi:sensor histidine kinase YesM